jgi:predicted anti-sigma-YlaC factor YlaD
MNCEKTRKWISLDLDGELSPRRAARLHAHLDGCPICRRARNEWVSVGVQMRERRMPAMQTPEAAWADVRRAIHNAQEERGETEKAWVLGAPLRWAVTMLLSMILGAGLFMTFQKSPAGMTRAGAMQVEFVETGLPNATPMVYEDAKSGWTIIWIVEANGKEGGHAGT